ncbi:MAG: hypothetical protein RJA44_1291 [Pseudomonadota bacterium]
MVNTKPDNSEHGSARGHSSGLSGITGTTAFPIDRADLVVGLGRGLAVIEAFDDEHARMTCAEVALRTDLSRSAVKRHLLSLCHYGYAETDGKHFWLAPRVLRLGQGYLEGARLPRLVQPFIQRLSMQSGETVNVSVLDGHEVVYVARSNSPRVLSIGFHVGARVPAHVVAPGMVLLATLPEEALQHWVAEHEFAGFTANTVVQAEAFAAQVRAARQMNHWVTQGQLHVGMMGVATVLKDRHGQCKGAIGMTLQSADWSPERIDGQLLPQLHETARTLRSLL